MHARASVETEAASRCFAPWGPHAPIIRSELGGPLHCKGNGPFRLRKQTGTERDSSSLRALCALASGIGASRPSGGTKSYPKCPPMAPAHENRRRQVLDQHEFPAPHVAAIGLQQKPFRIVGDLLDRTIVVDTTIAAVSRVPDRVLALGLSVVGIMGREVASLRPGHAEHVALVRLLQRILDRG